ncbi:hypothetical protein [Nitrosomonas communis]|nr:hypothetical protein [Nitrosomonas communis]
MTRRRAADKINNTAGEADKVSFDSEMEILPQTMLQESHGV